MKLKSIMKSVIIFLTLFCIAACSKSQEEHLFTETNAAANDIESVTIEESALCDIYDFENEEDSSDRNVSLPFIMFSDRELSKDTTKTEGTLYFPDGNETTLKEYSVSCLYGKLDKVNGVKRDITDNSFTYTISGNMEEDIITIHVFGEDGYKAANYIYVKKVINEKGMPVFVLKKNSSGIGNAED